MLEWKGVFFNGLIVEELDGGSSVHDVMLRKREFDQWEKEVPLQGFKWKWRRRARTRIWSSERALGRSSEPYGRLSEQGFYLGSLLTIDGVYPSIL